MSTRSALVVGAGIVGLSVAFHLHRDGHTVTIVDRDPAGDRASFGNAGGIAVTEVLPASVPGLLWKVPGWLLDPLGPLAIRPGHAWRLLPWLHRFARAGRPAEVERISTALAALNGRTYDDLLPLLAATGLTGELRRTGALTIYDSTATRDRDAAAWALKRRHGITAEFLDGPAVRMMEPALGPLAACGVWTPQWSILHDPKRLWTGLRDWLLDEGVQLVAGTVQGVESGRATLTGGKTLATETVIVAAGAWSADLARRAGDRVLLESERGYNVTVPDPGVTLTREIIFADRSIVATPLASGLRVGGAAEFGGLTAAPNPKRPAALAQLAALYLPALRTQSGHPWAGHRPTTPDSLPVIGQSRRHPGLFHAFGHGHLGLTQAATTGRLIADLVSRRTPPIEMTPFGIERFGRTTG